MARHPKQIAPHVRVFNELLALSESEQEAFWLLAGTDSRSWLARIHPWREQKYQGMKQLAEALMQTVDKRSRPGPVRAARALERNQVIDRLIEQGFTKEQIYLHLKNYYPDTVRIRTGKDKWTSLENVMENHAKYQRKLRKASDNCNSPR